MKLEVFDNRQDKADKKASSRIVANYSANTQLTTVVIDADILTIGVTMKVLEEKFESYLDRLPSEMQERVRRAVDGAIGDMT